MNFENDIHIQKGKQSKHLVFIIITTKPNGFNVKRMVSYTICWHNNSNISFEIYTK